MRISTLHSTIAIKNCSLEQGFRGEDMKNQQNEKAKLTASYLNGIAIAVALAGP